MADAPTFDDFLADPVTVWVASRAAISDDWAVQAARSSRAFREHLRSELADAVRDEGSFASAARQAEILATLYDAEDIAELFRVLAAVRPPSDWAAEFGKRFARRSVPPPADR